MVPIPEPEHTEIEFSDLPEDIQELISSAKGEKKSIATRLVELADELIDVVAGPDGEAHAIRKDGPKIALPLKGKSGLRQTLAREYYNRSGSTANAAALGDALEVLSGRAQEMDRVELPLRLTERDGVVYIDMGTADGAVLTVSPTGWKITNDHPVVFRRTELTGAMVKPTPGGDLHKLKDILNVDEKNFRLIVSWMIAALLPGMPHPILALFGQQGTAKTTGAKTVINLVDPSPAPTRSSPRDLGQWLTTAAGCWVSGIDNVSSIPEWFSDAMCRASTGEGVVNRSLYTDSNLSVSAFRRCIVMTGIATESLRGDLAERLLMIELEPISKAKRKTDADVEARFSEIAPEVLGGLLDLLVKVQEAHPSIKLEEMGRMADFTVVLAALDKVTGWSTVDDYVDTGEDIARTVVDGDLFATALRGLAQQAGVWEGTAQALFDLITPERPPQKWPKSATAVGARLARLAPAMESVGVIFEKAERGKFRGWSIRETSAEEVSKVSNVAKQSPHQGERLDTLVDTLNPQGVDRYQGVDTLDTLTDSGNQSVDESVDVKQAPDQVKHTRSDTFDTFDTSSAEVSKCLKCGTPLHNGECIRCRFEQAS